MLKVHKTTGLAMSLTHEFFIHREGELNKWERQGEIELEGFLKKNDLTVSSLIDAGLLGEKGIQSTSDIFNYQLKDTGKPYLHEMRRFQLLFVKKGKAQALLDAIGNTHKK